MLFFQMQQQTKTTKREKEWKKIMKIISVGPVKWRIVIWTKFDIQNKKKSFFSTENTHKSNKLVRQQQQFIVVWSEWEKNEIHSVNRRNGKNRANVINVMTSNLFCLLFIFRMCSIPRKFKIDERSPIQSYPQINELWFRLSMVFFLFWVNEENCLS